MKLEELLEKLEKAKSDAPSMPVTISTVKITERSENRTKGKGTLEMPVSQFSIESSIKNPDADMSPTLVISSFNPFTTSVECLINAISKYTNTKDSKCYLDAEVFVRNLTNKGGSENSRVTRCSTSADGLSFRIFGEVDENL